MDLNTKAYYNLLQMRFLENPSLDYETWQVENLREISEDELLRKLQVLGISWTKNDFLCAADEAESPEALAYSMLGKKEGEKVLDPGYLLIFELWRRYLPDRQTLSLFCDELDCRIFHYDRGEVKNDELIQDSLASLIDILNENTDKGGSPHKVFHTFEEFCAHDLEQFLYDYILEQIDVGNEVYASELLEGFSPYFKKKRRAEFLKARLLFSQNQEESTSIVQKLLTGVEKDPDLSFQLDVLDFIILLGEDKLFSAWVKKTLPLLESEGDFWDLLSISADYFQRNDQEKMEGKIRGIMQKREDRDPAQSFTGQDSDLKEFSSFFE